MIDETHDPARRSFLPVAADSPFPIQNLPFGVFRPHRDDAPRVGVALGEHVIDLAGLAAAGLFEPRDVPAATDVFSAPALNSFMALGPTAWRSARLTLSRLLRHDEATLRDDAALRAACIHRMDAVELLLPARIGDFTDFYSSRQHATNVGRMFRDPADPLLPNWLHLPVAYHGRSSSVLVSDAEITRPCGQTRPDPAAPPVFGPSRFVDFELELGAFVGPGNPLGQPIPVDAAPGHLFGLVLLNDWSARDLQRWEYVPLGPFLAKNFATTISPWVVTFDALAPFRRSAAPQDPAPLPYLRETVSHAYDLHLEVSLRPAGAAAAYRLCRSNAQHLYWSFAQQLAHHTCNGCNLRPGDLLGTGTISGDAPDSYGSLLELAWQGQRPLTLPNGQQRRAVEDGDTITLTGWGERDGVRIGFGDCRARLAPAHRSTD